MLNKKGIWSINTLCLSFKIGFRVHCPGQSSSAPTLSPDHQPPSTWMQREDGACPRLFWDPDPYTWLPEHVHALKSERPGGAGLGGAGCSKGTALCCSSPVALRASKAPVSFAFVATRASGQDACPSPLPFAASDPVGAPSGQPPVRAIAGRHRERWGRPWQLLAKFPATAACGEDGAAPQAGNHSAGLGIKGTGGRPGMHRGHGAAPAKPVAEPGLCPGPQPPNHRAEKL